MFEATEDFFRSIGWPALPPTFWKNSVLAPPSPESDKVVTCHPTAWDMYGTENGNKDLRFVLFLSTEILLFMAGWALMCSRCWLEFHEKLKKSQSTHNWTKNTLHAVRYFLIIIVEMEQKSITSWIFIFIFCILKKLILCIRRKVLFIYLINYYGGSPEGTFTKCSRFVK